MIYEMRTYSLAPGGAREYLALYNELGRAVQTDILGNLVSLMTPESGDQNQLIYIWAYENFDDRKERRAKLLENDQFTAFRKASRHLLIRQENRFLNPA